jgi:D-serine deaminase-like pyridoxal phosphate-dependent protein
MNIENYRIKYDKKIISPSLIYYKDIIKKNTSLAIETAGGPERLWPHVKSHKMSEMINMQMDLGITKFKCATIAEGEMLAKCKAKEILVAYPLVGPNIERFIDLSITYPDSNFWAIGDNLGQLKCLGEISLEKSLTVNFLVDVNVGMNRTGVSLKNTFEFCIKASEIKGLKFQGLHCYDGHLGSETDLANRQKAVDEIMKSVKEIKIFLESKGLICSALIMGGTPTFPCYARYDNLFLSPGTLFIWDYGYNTKFKDMKYTPGGAILTRVISCPKEGYFTLDLGHKHISTDSKGGPGKLIGVEAVELPLSEEHWPFKSDKIIPKVGDVMYVVPSHICPTTALYDEILVAENSEIIDTWKVIARGKRIKI